MGGQVMRSDAPLVLLKRKSNFYKSEVSFVNNSLFVCPTKLKALKSRNKFADNPLSIASPQVIPTQSDQRELFSLVVPVVKRKNSLRLD